MSFAEWTAASIRPSNSASSSSLAKTPRSPICPNGLRRSRSPAVVIGTRAISRPGRRRSSAASDACVSASRLPREPRRRSTSLLFAEAEQVPDGFGVAPPVRPRRGLLQPDRGQVEELVHDLSRDRLDGRVLRLGEAEPAAGALQLAGANLLCPRAERSDRGDDLAGGLALTKLLGFLRDDRFGARGLAPSPGKAGRHDRLEIVDVVEVAVFELVDRRVEIAGDSEIDQEERPPLPAAQCGRNSLAVERPA